MPVVRESGMPPQDLWESFFDPPRLLDVLGCRDLSADVVEFGCGYGTFTLEAARRTRACVYGLDIDPDKVRTTAARAAQSGLPNVHAEVRDFVLSGSGRPDSSAAFVMLFNIMHIENPLALLSETRRILRPGATAGIIHWRRDDATPRGPPLAMRPEPGQCREWAAMSGLAWVATPALPGNPWHWGMVLARR